MHLRVLWLKQTKKVQKTFVTLLEQCAVLELVLCGADFRLILWGVADFRWRSFLQYDSNR